MGIRLRRAKDNRAYYDPNIGRANYDMDQRVSSPAGQTSEPRRSWLVTNLGLRAMGLGPNSAPAFLKRSCRQRSGRHVWRKWRRDLILISPRIPRKVSSIPRS